MADQTPHDQKTRWKRTLEACSLGFFVGTMCVAPTLVLLLTVFSFCTPFFVIPLLYVAWMYHDRDMQNRGGRKLHFFMDLKIWDHTADYFPAQLVKTADLDTDHNYIFAWHPHGIIGCGAIANILTNGTGFRAKFPGIRRYLATLEMNFFVPLRRDLLAAFGCVSVSAKSLSHILSRREKGQSVTVVVGGAEEALEAHPGNYRLCLKERKGFCKLALRNGASIVPVYTFGETALYYQYPNPQGSQLRKIQTAVKQWIGISPVIVVGTGFLLKYLGLLPFRERLITVFGAPIHVTKVDEPTLEQVNQLHNEYKAKLSELFETHKHLYGVDADTHLEYY